MKLALFSGKYREFIGLMKTTFASIPSILNKQDEKYYHSLFYLTISLMIDYLNSVQAEVLTNIGRIDMVLSIPEKVFIFEFKIDRTAEKAIEQIKQKKYAEKYLTEGKKIILIGIDFSSTERNIRDYKVEEMD